jgi:hypothetical protein
LIERDFKIGGAVERESMLLERQTEERERFLRVCFLVGDLQGFYATSVAEQLEFMFVTSRRS